MLSNNVSTKSLVKGSGFLLAPGRSGRRILNVFLNGRPCHFIKRLVHSF